MTYKIEIYFDIKDDGTTSEKFPIISANAKRAIYGGGADHVFAPKITDIFDKQLFPRIKEEIAENSKEKEGKVVGSDGS